MRELDFTPFSVAIQAADTILMASLEELTLQTTITDLREQFKQGLLSSFSLTLFYLLRIQKYDTRLRSIIELNPDALTEATRLDELSRRDMEEGLLHGIPVLLKDNIATGDRLHNTAGSLALRHHRAPDDALLVKQLRSAGALILGKTNMSEWAFAMSSNAPSGYSARGGQVVNPFARELEVAGSSTGSAVAVAARFAVAAIGTETAGSIIAPASFNGVAGMRPTTGLVSNDRIIPVCSSLDSAGPIARSVHDLTMLLTVIATQSEQSADSNTSHAQLARSFTVSLKDKPLAGLRIAVIRGCLLNYSDTDETLLGGLLKTLDSAGCRMIDVSIPDDKSAELLADRSDMLFSDMRNGINAYLKHNHAPVSTLNDIIAFNKADPKQRIPYGQDLLIRAQGCPMTSDEYATLTASTQTCALGIIRNAADTVDADILLSLDNHFSYVYSAAGVPAVTIPVGRDQSGQPHGATLVGVDRKTDNEVLAIARAVEKKLMLFESPQLE
ncbi:MAG: amidase family protein [Granulosicoccus sp.]